MNYQISEQLRVLGLSGDVPWTEVKRAYRERIRECHPDKFAQASGGTSEAERITKSLNEAYQVLKEYYSTIRVERLSVAIRRASKHRFEEMYRTAENAQRIRNEETQRESSRGFIESVFYAFNLSVDVICQTCALVFSPTALCLVLVFGFVIGHPSPGIVKQMVYDIVGNLRSRFQNSSPSVASFDGKSNRFQFTPSRFYRSDR